MRPIAKLLWCIVALGCAGAQTKGNDQSSSLPSLQESRAESDADQPSGQRGAAIVLFVDDLEKAARYYRTVFGATQTMQLTLIEEAIKIVMKFGDSEIVLMNGRQSTNTISSPREKQGVSGSVHLYVEDADTVFRRAVDNGATITVPIALQFWGALYGEVVDPFGIRWQIATQVEAVDFKEIARRAMTPCDPRCPRSGANSNVPAKPPGFRTATPWLVVDDLAKAVEYYRRAFWAREVLRLPGPDGNTTFVLLRMLGSHIMVGKEIGHYRSPKTLKGTTMAVTLYVDNVDAVVANAVRHGATQPKPVENTFWGERFGSIFDPFGHAWAVAKKIETLTQQELQNRFDQLLHQQ